MSIREYSRLLGGEVVSLRFLKISTVVTFRHIAPTKDHLGIERKQFVIVRIGPALVSGKFKILDGIASKPKHSGLSMSFKEHF